MSSFEFISLSVWVGVIALQLADLTLTASRVPQLSAYNLLRDELQDAAGSRLSAEQLTDLRNRLATLDEREAERVVPPSRGVNAQLWKGTPWQLGAVVFAFVPLAAALTRILTPTPAIAAVQPYDIVALTMGLLLPVIGYLLALAVARASLSAAGARSNLHSQLRSEIVVLLDHAAKSSRQRVAGLGDRVARALQILREQQAQQQ